VKITKSPRKALVKKPIGSDIGKLRDESLVSSATYYEAVSL
jgi:hypothetical protein